MFEKIKWFLQDHKYEMKIAAIGVAISVGLALAAGGDVGDALARRRRS